MIKKIYIPKLPLTANRILDSLFIHEYEIWDMIKTLDINKAVGEDKIRHLVLKNTSKYISKPLSLLFTNRLIDILSYGN